MKALIFLFITYDIHEPHVIMITKIHYIKVLLSHIEG